MKISMDELKKLLKEKTPKQVIYMHTMSKITLSSKQLDYVLRMKSKEAEKEK